jgi:catechol 2,3-dioxygenase-like lactoylglutathione lyase family enzyme
MARSKSRTGKRKAAKRPHTAAAARRTGKKPAVRRSAAAKKLKDRRDPETLRLRSITPSLTVNDIEKSVRFYTDVLGFIVRERWEEGGQLQGVMLKAGGCEIGLSQDDWAKGRDRKKGEGMRLWCETAQDVDALAARIKSAGGRLTQEPRDEMGGRNLWVDDLDGYHLSLSMPK